MPSQLIFRIHAALSTVVILSLGGVIATGVIDERGFERTAVIDKLTVRHIDVLDDEDRVRVQIAGGFPPRRQELCGILFHNQDGHEAGALVYTGQSKPDGSIAAGAILTFDQYREDQITTLEYSHTDGKKRNGLRIVDRPDELGENMKAFYEAYYDAGSDEERRKIQADMLPLVPAEERAQRRVFVGRNTAGDAVLTLADAAGNPRIRLSVTEEGESQILFLDEHGQVARTLSADD